MAVRKKKKTLSKKTTKKKVAKKNVPHESTDKNGRVIKRLDEAEMRKLEELYHGVGHLETKCRLQEQYTANVRLKIESLQSKIQLLEYEVDRASEKQKTYASKLKSKMERLNNLGNELKSKYGIKSQGHISYDSLSGEIQDK